MFHVSDTVSSIQTFRVVYLVFEFEWRCGSREQRDKDQKVLRINHINQTVHTMTYSVFVVFLENLNFRIVVEMVASNHIRFQLSHTILCYQLFIAFPH